MRTVGYVEETKKRTKPKKAEGSEKSDEVIKEESEESEKE